MPSPFQLPIDVAVPFELAAGLVFALVMSPLLLIGCFRSVTFQKGNLPPRMFVYTTNSGPLAKVGPHFEAVIDFMKKRGFDESKIPTAGIYYDNPSKVIAPRYAVGFLIDEDDTESIKKWENLSKDTKSKWSVLHLKATPTIVSIFPMRWKPASCAISAMKTYPAFQESGHDLKCGSVEVYRADTKTVETHFPQGNQEQFNPQALDFFPAENLIKKEQ